MSYRNMTGLACFVASQHVAEYDRDTVETMVEDVKKIRKWIDEIVWEDEYKEDE
jgi:hypothetical protein